jgi:hypothetical protein
MSDALIKAVERLANEVANLRRDTLPSRRSEVVGRRTGLPQVVRERPGAFSAFWAAKADHGARALANHQRSAGPAGRIRLSSWRDTRSHGRHLPRG